MAFKWFRFLFAQSGDRSAIPGPVDLSGNVSFEQGYGPDYQRPKTDPLAKDIERDKMNSLFYDLSGNIQHYQLNGVPDWVPAADNGGVAVSYPAGARVRYSDGFIYMSRKAANTSLPTVTADWFRETGRLMAMVMVTTSQTVTPPAGALTYVADAIGGGGAGGGCPAVVSSQVACGSGGTAGSRSIGQFNVSGNIGVTIGAGGTPVSGSSGGNGGTTTVGTMTAPGGPGGSTGGPTSAPYFTSGTNGTTGTNGNILAGTGQPGFMSLALQSNASLAGAGGSSVYGGGGQALGGKANGNSPSVNNYGAGGGGTANDTGNGALSGGAGVAGCALIYFYG